MFCQMVEQTKTKYSLGRKSWGIVLSLKATLSKVAFFIKHIACLIRIR